MKGMGDFEELAEDMVENQIAARDVSDERVLDAFKKVPRHEFISGGEEKDAYGDYPLPIGHGQTISQPYMVAKMTELLELDGSEKVLEIGTGSGYQTAILCELAGEVVSVERIGKLADRAEEKLKDMGYDNFKIVVSDGTMGYEDEAPYDAILVTAAAPKIPEPMKGQLADGGVMVLPVGERHNQQLLRIRRKRKNLSQEEVLPCRFVPLMGEYGW